MRNRDKFYNRYAASINKAINYIQENLDLPISLEKISKVTGFSQFHFHRIFSVLMGESIGSFIRRIRLEKAASFLYYYPDKSITEIAYDCGFSSSQLFARSFKEQFLKTPSEYRKLSLTNTLFSKENHTISKKWKVPNFTISYTSTQGRPNLIFKSINMKVEVVDFPDMPVAYVRHIGPYKGNPNLFGELFDKMCKWAGARGLLNENMKMFSIYYDNPDVTDTSKLRLDVCVSVPKGTKTEGEVSSQVIKGGKYAVAQFTVKTPEEYQEVWDKVYKEWLPESGFQPDDKPSFEMYDSDCKTKEGEYEHVVKICLPVKPA